MRYWTEWARDLDEAKRTSALFRWLCSFRVTAYAVAVIVFIFALVAPAYAAEPGDLEASRYVWQATANAGGAVIQNAFGGEYVYSRAPEASDGRTAQRFYIGRPPRNEYTLFSAEEEAALWSLRDHERHRNDPVVRRHIHVLAMPARAPALVIDWPRVIALADRVCVPVKGFADAADWREHLVCWLKEAQRVE